MPELLRIEVADQHGVVAMVIDQSATSAGQRVRLDELAGHAIRSVAGLPGVTGEGHAREIILAKLVRQHADELAYERVAERRGLLPL